MTMAYSQAQLDALRAAVAQGVLEAQLPDGSRVRYRSQNDLLAMIAKIEQELSVNPAHTNVVYPTHARGFHE